MLASFVDWLLDQPLIPASNGHRTMITMIVYQINGGTSQREIPQAYLKLDAVQHPNNEWQWNHICHHGPHWTLKVLHWSLRRAGHPNGHVKWLWPICQAVVIKLREDECTSPTLGSLECYILSAISCPRQGFSKLTNVNRPLQGVQSWKCTPKP